MSPEKAQVLVDAIRASARYFEAMHRWSERNQEDGDVHRIPEGSEPDLDKAFEDAMHAVMAAQVVLGDRRAG